jgi:hypothetical protein
MFTNVKIIDGKETESRIVQDPMFIYIMKEFGEEKNIPLGQEARYFKQSVKNIHHTMKSPYGKLESMRKNSAKSDIQSILYAIKDLEIVPRIISEEEYFRQTCVMDPEFMKNWNLARQETQRFLNTVKKYGPGNRKTSITMSMLDRYVKDKNFNKLQDGLEQSINGLFRSWQNLWSRYQEISTFAENLGKDPYY